MQFLVQGPLLSSRLRALALSSDTARWLPDVEVSFAGRSGGEGAPASRVDEADWEISRWDGHTGAPECYPAARWGATLTAVSAHEAVLLGGVCGDHTAHDVWQLTRQGPGRYLWRRARILQAHDYVRRLGQRRALHAAALLPGGKLLVSGGIGLGRDERGTLSVLNLSKSIWQWEPLEICAAAKGDEGALVQSEDGHQVFRGGHIAAVALRRDVDSAWCADALVLGGICRLGLGHPDVFAKAALSYELRGSAHEASLSMGVPAYWEDEDEGGSAASDLDDESAAESESSAGDGDEQSWQPIPTRPVRFKLPSDREADRDDGEDEAQRAVQSWRPTRDENAPVVDEEARAREDALRRAPPRTITARVGGARPLLPAELRVRSAVHGVVGRQLLSFGGCGGATYARDIVAIPMDSLRPRTVPLTDDSSSPLPREGACFAYDALAARLIVTGGAVDGAAVEDHATVWAMSPV